MANYLAVFGDFDSVAVIVYRADTAKRGNGLAEVLSECDQQIIVYYPVLLRQFFP